jgi:DNA polymerase-1
MVYLCDLRALSRNEWATVTEVVRLLFSGCLEVVAHNAKYDVLLLSVACHLTPDDLKGLWLYDSMLAEQVLLGGALADDGKRERAALDATGARYGHTIPKEARSFFEDLDLRPAWDEPLPLEQLTYSARDVAVLPSIRREQEALADAHDLGDTLALEMSNAPAIIAMELRGVGVQVEGWRAALCEMHREAEEWETCIQAELFPAYRAAKVGAQLEQTQALTLWKAGHDAAIEQARASHSALTIGQRPTWGDVRKTTISKYRAEHPRPPTPAPLPDRLNLHSPAQLLESLALLGVYLTDTAAETLENEAEKRPDHPALVALVEWRGVSKNLDAFGETILARVQADGRLHPSWRQIGSEERGIATGRMSCSAPNLQQLPSRGSGAQLRRHIVASPGHTLVSCDLSQIEPRILAERSADPALLALFAGGQDLYTAIAIQLGLLPVGATKQDAKTARFGEVSVRDAAKTLTLATIYGMWASGLSIRLGCDKETAQAHLDTFFDLFPGVARYKDHIEQIAMATGVARSIGGRWRVFRRYPEPARRQFATWDGFMAARGQWWKDKNRMLRQAVNHTIQATGADILKLGMILAFQRLPSGAHLIGAIHDELLVEAPSPCADEAARILAGAMEEAARAYLPTVDLGYFEVSTGSHWMKA